MYQSRSYVVGIRTNEPFPNGMYISVEEPRTSFRSTPWNKGELVLVGQGSHRTGSAEDHLAYYRDLENFVKEIYKGSTIEYRWSTQDNITVDGLPYIGKITRESEHVYIGTGFGKWGMSNGTLSAMMITDMIKGRPSPWAELYDPSRFKPLASAKELTSHMLTAAKELISGYISSSPSKKPEELKNDEGALMSYKGEEIGAYRDSTGKLYKVSPICKHMGCPLMWNNAEKSWDCTCHGSRYNFNGEVIQGPAVTGLDKKD